MSPPVDRRRIEDPPLVTGEARFTDDLREPGMLHAAFVRSHHAHARITSVDTSRAAALDGVIDVFTMTDLEAADTPTPSRIPSHGAPSPESPMPPEAVLRRPLASVKARYQGDPLAVVLATDPYVAREGADLVAVSYDRLEPVVDLEAATNPGAARVHDGTPDNIAFEVEDGDQAAVHEAFDRAANTIELTIDNQRLVQNPIEPRAILANPDPASGKLLLSVTTQYPHQFRRIVAKVLDLPENQLEVVAPSVGGAFGSKIPIYPAEVVVSWCALHLGQPIKWHATRTEAYQSDAQGRGLPTTGRLAIDSDGSFLAFELEGKYDLGAYISSHAAMIVSAGVATMSGQYEIPHLYSHITGILTNKTPLDAYRGVTEPPIQQTLERLIDKGARETGFDPVTLRRQNFIPPEQFPYETPIGSVYDSGRYERAFDLALDEADYTEYKQRQEELRDEGRYLGIGLAPWIEAGGLGPCAHEARRIATWGYSKLLLHPSGAVTAHVGSADQGQGHRTSFTHLLEDWLGIPGDDIDVVLQDTSKVPEGVGSFGSRTAPVEGGALRQSAKKILEKARAVAAFHLEVHERDLSFADGEFRLEGTPEVSVSLRDIAHEAHHGRVPDHLEPGLEVETYYDPENFTFSFGTHIAVVEVDPETGDVDFEAYVAVEDCGHQIDPRIVEGQVHGGTAQGIGQALYEGVVYDDNGTLLTGSHLDYAIPRATHIPRVETHQTTTPSPHNPLGVKGVGESGAIAAPIAVANAIHDALEPFDVESVTPPFTPERLWEVLREASPTIVEPVP